MQKLINRIKNLDTTKKIAIGFVLISFIFIITVTLVNMMHGNHIEKEAKVALNANKNDDSKKQKTHKNDNNEANKQEVSESDTETKDETNTNTDSNVDQNDTQNSQNQSPSSNDEKDVPDNSSDVKPAVDYININVTIYGLDDAMIGTGNVSLEKGKSAFDALQLFATQQNISLTTSGYGSFVYVTGINGLKEKEYGGSSGWVYMINGERIMSGAGRYAISENVSMEWKYVYN